MKFRDFIAIIEAEGFQLDRTTDTHRQVAEIDALALKTSNFMRLLFVFGAMALQIITEDQLYQFFPELGRQVAAAFPPVESTRD